MNESDFKQLVYQQLVSLRNLFDHHNKYDDIECDLFDDVLYINLPDDRQYVINRHLPSLQIWLSSPLSGANYFNYNSSNKQWLDKHQQDLKQIIQQEIDKVIDLH